MPGNSKSVACNPRPRWATVLAIALVLRLALVSFVAVRLGSTSLYRSQGELGFVAESIVHGNGLSSPFGGSTGPTAFLSPGYPALIALVFRCFGVFSSDSALAIMVLQTAFCVATIYLVMRVAQQEFGATAANACGFFWAVNPVFIWLPAVFWDTGLTLLLVSAAMAISLRTVSEPATMKWVGMGLLGGLTLLVNPTLILLLACLFGWTCYQARQIRGPLVALALALLMYAPWPVRNMRVMHAFIPFRTNFGLELWRGNHPGATVLDQNNPYPVWDRAEYEQYATKGELAFMREKSETAKQYIRSHPGEFIRLTAKRFLAYWTGIGSAQGIPLALILLTTACGLLGLGMLIREHRRGVAMLFLLPLCVSPLPYYITHAELRFRLVLEPLLTILSSYALTKLAQRRNTTPVPIAPSTAS